MTWAMVLLLAAPLWSIDAAVLRLKTTASGSGGAIISDVLAGLCLLGSAILAAFGL